MGRRSTEETHDVGSYACRRGRIMIKGKDGSEKYKVTNTNMKKERTNKKRRVKKEHEKEKETMTGRRNKEICNPYRNTH
jgi:hypothetical protein